MRHLLAPTRFYCRLTGGLGALVSLALACGPLAPEPTPEEALLGKWVPAEGGSHCLALDAEHHFELTRRGNGNRAEAVVNGTYRLDLAADALFVTPERIHTLRFVSTCRKHVDSARDHEVFEMLRGDFALGVETKLTVTRDGDRMRLCHVDCADLVREP